MITLGVLFWLLIILWFIFGVVMIFPRGENRNYLAFSGSFLTWLLFVIVGLKLFGAPFRMQ